MSEVVAKSSYEILSRNENIFLGLDLPSRFDFRGFEISKNPAVMVSPEQMIKEPGVFAEQLTTAFKGEIDPEAVVSLLRFAAVFGKVEEIIEKFSKCNLEFPNSKNLFDDRSLLVKKLDAAIMSGGLRPAQKVKYGQRLEYIIDKNKPRIQRPPIVLSSNIEIARRDLQNNANIKKVASSLDLALKDQPSISGVVELLETVVDRGLLENLKRAFPSEGRLQAFNNKMNMAGVTGFNGEEFESGLQTEVETTLRKHGASDAQIRFIDSLFVRSMASLQAASRG